MEFVESEISESNDGLEFEKYNEQADETMSTIPTVEQLPPKNPTWGPIIPIRRSSRVEIGENYAGNCHGQ